LGAERVAEILGGKEAIGVDITSQMDLVHAIRAGLPFRVLDWIIDHEVLTRPEVEHYVIPRRTMAYRKRSGARLSSEESDRLTRVARIVALTEETFGDRGKASHWLRMRNPSLGGDRPLDLLDTTEGAHLVETILIRLAHGVYS
jgi:putative toxin-antitoxin system antitoxin component (TIGR02293 family)